MSVLQLFLSAVFFFTLFSYGQDNVLSVCDRTSQVRNAIVEKIKQETGVEDCSLMTPLLSFIEFLDLEEHNITELKSGDFSGLSSLQQLNLNGNHISVVPNGVFSGLSSLQWLALKDNRFLTEEKERIRRSLPPAIEIKL